MLQMMASDVLGILQRVFLNGDWVSLAIAFGSVLAAAFVMRRAGQIGGMTLLALAVFALANIVRSVVAAPTPTPGATASATGGKLESTWIQFMNMQAGTLIAYFIAFMGMIFLIYSVKSAIRD